jgi:hypothetical protein
VKASFALVLAIGLFSSGALRAAEDADDGAAASAEEEEPRPSERAAAPEDPPPSYGHAKQLGLRVALVGGYRMVLRYDESPWCANYDLADGNDQRKFCGFGAPLALDLALSGALIDSLEPFLWARVGLAGETDTNTKPLLILGAGTRIYTMSDSAFKIYVEPAIGLEIEGKGGSNDLFRRAVEAKHYRTDLLFHLAAGPHFDIGENFGLYADAGLTLGVLRYLHSTLEVKAGVQGRLP